MEILELTSTISHVSLNESLRFSARCVVTVPHLWPGPDLPDKARSFSMYGKLSRSCCSCRSMRLTAPPQLDHCCVHKRFRQHIVNMRFQIFFVSLCLKGGEGSVWDIPYKPTVAPVFLHPISRQTCRQCSLSWSLLWPYSTVPDTNDRQIQC